MSNEPKRIQLSRRKGWRMPPNTISVARPTKWGNPWRVGLHGDADYCVQQFRKWLLGEIRDPFGRGGPSLPLIEIRGKSLACWCKSGAPCHADVLLEMANS